MAERRARRLLLIVLSMPACAPDTPVECIEPATESLVPSGDRSAECAAQDAAMQTVLDSHRTTPNALLAVRNDVCGTSVHISGDACHAHTSSLWRIGSVTKTYVAATLLSLAGEGRLSPDDSVSTWLPDFPELSAVTLRMLLTHRSGIFNYTEDRAFQRQRDRALTPEEIIRPALAHPRYFPPDTGFHYSNTNYILLGRVIEAATGERLSAAIRARALLPAGLAQTFLDGEEPPSGALARGFAGRKDVTNLNHPSRPWAAGAMVASGADLVNWVWTLFGTDQVLSAELRRLATDAADAPDSNGFGLGVMVLRDPADPTRTGYGHNGAIDGYATTAFYFPKDEAAVAVVVNGPSKKPPDIIRHAALEALAGRP